MAFTYKNKRLGYDNIANGSAAGFERHNAGTSPSETSAPNRDSGGNTSTSMLAIGRRENVVHNPTTDDYLVGIPRANSSDIASTSGYTSETSSTSVFPEKVG